MKNRDLKIVQNRKRWFVISLAIITFGVIMFAVFAGVGKSFNKGFNLGIEFTGGTQLDVELGSLMNNDNKEEIKNIIIDTLNERGIRDRNEIQLTDKGYTVIYRAPEEETDLLLSGSEGILSLQARLISEINTDNSDLLIKVNSYEATPKVKTSALFYVLLGVLVAWVLIMVYVFFRFELSASIAAAIGLIHDVLMIFAVMAIFHIPLNLSFFAALIVLICYSTYNSIIVFDRMRLNSRRESMKDSTVGNLVDTSVKEVFKRVLCTTAIISIMVLPLIITGVPVIWIVIPAVLGLAAAAYSSLFVVPSIWALYNSRQKSKKGKTEFFKKRVLFKRTEKTEPDIENEKDE